MASFDREENDGKHKKVFSWLQEIFGDEPIPQFEINTTTLDILEQLANRNRQQNKDGDIVSLDCLQKTSEYKAEVQRLSRIIEHVGLPVTAMSQSGRMSVKTLASVALILGTKDCSTSSLLLGITEQSQALSSVIDANTEEKRLLSRLLIKTKKAQANVSDLQRSLDGLQEQVALQAPKLEKNSQETGFVKRKCKEYARINKELEGYQAKVQLDPSLYHESLVKRSEDIKNTREKIRPLKVKLEGYHSLPPDISQAKAKVEEAKRQLELLEQQLSININTLHL